MSSALTTEAVSLALDIAQARAEAASRAIAASSTGGTATRPDFRVAVGLLRRAAADPDLSAKEVALQGNADVRAALQGASPLAHVDPDQEVAALVMASLDYRALTTALNQQFGLMQLAVGGK